MSVPVPDVAEKSLDGLPVLDTPMGPLAVLEVRPDRVKGVIELKHPSAGTTYEFFIHADTDNPTAPWYQSYVSITKRKKGSGTPPRYFGGHDRQWGHTAKELSSKVYPVLAEWVEEHQSLVFQAKLASLEAKIARAATELDDLHRQRDVLIAKQSV